MIFNCFYFFSGQSVRVMTTINQPLKAQIQPTAQKSFILNKDGKVMLTTTAAAAAAAGSSPATATPAQQIITQAQQPTFTPNSVVMRGNQVWYPQATQSSDTKPKNIILISLSIAIFGPEI